MSDEFHDLFKQSVPAAPPTTGWVAGARRKRRNRQVLTGSVAALAVVALAVPVALNLTGSRQPVVASPEPSVVQTAPTEDPTQTPSETPSDPQTTEPGTQPSATGPEVALSPTADGQPGAAACYNEANEPIGDWINIGTIPTGAARAWLCTNPLNYGTAGPLEPLVTDVDGLIEALYAQPALTDDNAQAVAEYYTVVFEYDDGRKMSFTGDIQDSTELTDGVNKLQGSAAFFHEQVEARWLAQRAELGAPSGDTALAQVCPVTVNQSLFEDSIAEITSGYACVLDRGELRHSVELRDSLAAAIGAEMFATGVPTEAQEDNSGLDIRLVLRGAWGDDLILSKRGDTYEYRGKTSLMAWTPSPGFAAELDALFTN